MKILTKYTDIENFLYRFTLLKIGKLHIRLHKIVGPDKTTLFHNHPFHYISVILKGGYEETIIENKRRKSVANCWVIFCFGRKTFITELKESYPIHTRCSLLMVIILGTP